MAIIFDLVAVFMGYQVFSELTGDRTSYFAVMVSGMIFIGFSLFGVGMLFGSIYMLTNTLRDFKRCCKRAGIKTNDRLCQHCMRKSWATNLANGGTPIQTFMKMGGWSSIECCQEYYLKSTDANKQKVVQVLNGLFESGITTDTNKGKAGFG